MSLLSREHRVFGRDRVVGHAVFGGVPAVAADGASPCL